MFRGKLTFLVRDVLWLTLAAAIALGWFVHYRALQLRNAKRTEYIGRLKEELRITIGVADYFHSMIPEDKLEGVGQFPHGKLPPDLETEP